MIVYLIKSQGYLCGTFVFSNHWVDATASGQKESEGILQPSSQTCLTNFISSKISSVIKFKSIETQRLHSLYMYCTLCNFLVLDFVSYFKISGFHYFLYTIHFRAYIFLCMLLISRYSFKQVHSISKFAIKTQMEFLAGLHSCKMAYRMINGWSGRRA